MSAADSVSPVQLKMFMTAREITAQYAPHEGDRESTVVEQRRSPDPRAGELTGSRHQADGTKNYPRIHHGGNPLPEIETKPYYHPATIPMRLQAETNDELWERKAQESEVRPVTDASGATGTLANSVRKHGVTAPVSLTTKIGKEGKPMVAGGHHRVAVMAKHNPDALIPVVHHESFDKAKKDPKTTDYVKYT